MSHFTVLVIGDKIDEQMAPYAEQGFKEEYGIFNNKEEDSMQEYQNDEVEIVVCLDGTLHSKYAEQFSYYPKGSFSREWKYPEGSIIRQGKFSEIYPTFEDFMREWHGMNSRDEKTGLYGYWSNPNAKWDWYSLGGRWTGYFKPKASAVGKLGRSGAFDNKPTEGWVDSINLCDIDIAGMKEISVKKANDTYDKIEQILQGRTYPSWTAIREKHGENINAAREEFNSNEVVKDFNKSQFHIWGDFYEEYGTSRENYIEKCKNQTMVPYAVVKDGKWYQKGEMGWWGISNDEMSQDEWSKKFWEMINSLDPETELSLLDCHI